jgi:hypothetical protein
MEIGPGEVSGAMAGGDRLPAKGHRSPDLLDVFRPAYKARPEAVGACRYLEQGPVLVFAHSLGIPRQDTHHAIEQAIGDAPSTPVAGHPIPRVYRCVPPWGEIFPLFPLISLILKGKY